MDMEEELEIIYDESGSEDLDYSSEYEEMVENDEISAEEEGFMAGWIGENPEVNES